MRSGSGIDSKVLLLEISFYAPLDFTCKFKDTYFVEENNECIGSVTTENRLSFIYSEILVLNKVMIFWKKKNHYPMYMSLNSPVELKNEYTISLVSIFFKHFVLLLNTNAFFIFSRVSSLKLHFDYIARSK